MLASSLKIAAKKTAIIKYCDWLEMFEEQMPIAEVCLTSLTAFSVKEKLRPSQTVSNKLCASFLALSTISVSNRLIIMEICVICTKRR